MAVKKNNAVNFNSGRGEYVDEQNQPVKPAANPPGAHRNDPSEEGINKPQANSRDRYENADHYKGGRDFSKPEWGASKEDDILKEAKKE